MVKILLKNPKTEPKKKKKKMKRQTLFKEEKEDSQLSHAWGIGPLVLHPGNKTNKILPFPVCPF